MRRNKLALFLHLVWATWDRLPLITPDIERRLYRNIESEAQKQGCTVLALNTVPGALLNEVFGGFAGEGAGD